MPKSGKRHLANYGSRGGVQHFTDTGTDEGGSQNDLSLGVDDQLARAPVAATQSGCRSRLPDVVAVVDGFGVRQVKPPPLLV